MHSFWSKIVFYTVGVRPILMEYALYKTKYLLDKHSALPLVFFPYLGPDMQNMVIWYPYSSLENEVGWAGVSGKGEKAKG